MSLITNHTKPRESDHNDTDNDTDNVDPIFSSIENLTETSGIMQGTTNIRSTNTEGAGEGEGKLPSVPSSSQSYSQESTYKDEDLTELEDGLYASCDRESDLDSNSNSNNKYNTQDKTVTLVVTSSGIGNRNTTRQRVLWIVSMAIVLGALAALVVVVFAHKDSNNKEEQNKQPMENTSLDIPSSLFVNPSQVQWKIVGQVIADDQTTTTQGSFGTELGLSADATRLLVGTVARGYALMYHYNATADTWELRNRFTRPQKEKPAEEKSANLDPLFGSSVALAGDGNRLVVRGEDIVFTYDYDASTDAWIEHDQPVTEYQPGEDTGSSLDLDYYGTTLAVGAPRHDAHNADAGNIRILRKDTLGIWRLAAFIHGRNWQDRVGDRVRLSADGTTLVSGSFRLPSENGFASGVIWSWKVDTPAENKNQDTDEVEEWHRRGNAINGPAANAYMGNRLAISANGRILASIARYEGTETIFVYEFNSVTEEWHIRGDPLPIEGDSSSDVCMSADGNFVFAATRSQASAAQFDQSTKAWTTVGSFDSGDSAFGTSVACSADGRTVVIGNPVGGDSMDGTSETATVRIFRAVEV